jgi:hypothetical protein
MDADTRMALSLVLSLVVSAGNLRMAAGGHADIWDVGLRYVLAFVVSFVAVGAVGRVLRTYVAETEARQRAEAEERDAESVTAPAVDGMLLAEE